MAAAVYLLGTLTTLLCAILLLRRYAYGRARLLLWSGLCFAGLSLNNLLIFADLILLPQIDLYPVRLAAGGISMALLLYGLIWESQ